MGFQNDILVLFFFLFLFVHINSQSCGGLTYFSIPETKIVGSDGLSNKALFLYSILFLSFTPYNSINLFVFGKLSGVLEI